MGLLQLGLLLLLLRLLLLGLRLLLLQLLLLLLLRLLPGLRPRGVGALATANVTWPRFLITCRVVPPAAGPSMRLLATGIPIWGGLGGRRGTVTSRVVPPTIQIGTFHCYFGVGTDLGARVTQMAGKPARVAADAGVGGLDRTEGHVTRGNGIIRW